MLIFDKNIDLVEAAEKMVISLINSGEYERSVSIYNVLFFLCGLQVKYLAGYIICLMEIADEEDVFSFLDSVDAIFPDEITIDLLRIKCYIRFGKFDKIKKTSLRILNDPCYKNISKKAREMALNIYETLEFDPIQLES